MLSIAYETHPFSFISYPDTLTEQPEYGNNLSLTYNSDSIILYMRCSSNIAYLTTAFQPFFLKSNSFKLGFNWELRTSFTSAMFAADWGRKENEGSSIIALKFQRIAFEQILKEGIEGRGNLNSEVQFYWEGGRDIFGDPGGCSNLILFVKGELLNHMARYWVVNVYHMDAYMKNIFNLRDEDPENVFLPHERIYSPSDPMITEGLGLDADYNELGNIEPKMSTVEDAEFKFVPLVRRGRMQVMNAQNGRNEN